jgi:serine/threonine-protein kinase RsbW
MGAYEQPAQKKQEVERIAFHTELLQQKQAIEISQCAYRTYGYTYIMENIYYPDRLIEMTNSGELISAVAVTDETGEVMGHCALERFGRKRAIPEIGMAFTKPKFRGQGCMSHLNALLLDKAKELGIKGIYAKAVTTHPFSQKAVIKGNYKDSAILIGLSPPKKFAKMDAQGAQRESLVLCNLKLMEQEKINIFVPENHQEMLEKIYQNLQLDVEIKVAKNNADKQAKIVQSDLEIDVYDNLAYANLYMNAAGENLVLEIKHRIKELCQKKIEAINLYIDLCDEYAVSLVPELEELGFFFAGAFPNDEKQFLILQYLNNVPINYDKIVIVSEFANKLMDYIKQYDPNMK